MGWFSSCCTCLIEQWSQYEPTVIWATAGHEFVDLTWGHILGFKRKAAFCQCLQSSWAKMVSMLRNLVSCSSIHLNILSTPVLQVTRWISIVIDTFRIHCGSKCKFQVKDPSCFFVFRSSLKALSSSPVKVDSIQCAMVDRCLQGEIATGLFIWVKESLWCQHTRIISNNKIDGAEGTLIRAMDSKLTHILYMWQCCVREQHVLWCMWLCRAIYETATCEIVLW